MKAFSLLKFLKHNPPIINCSDTGIWSDVQALRMMAVTDAESLVIISDTRNVEINENCPFTCCAFSFHTRETGGAGDDCE